MKVSKIIYLQHIGNCATVGNNVKLVQAASPGLPCRMFKPKEIVLKPCEE